MRYGRAGRGGDVDLLRSESNAPLARSTMGTRDLRSAATAANAPYGSAATYATSMASSRFLNQRSTDHM